MAAEETANPRGKKTNAPQHAGHSVISAERRSAMSLDDADDHSSADGLAAFANGETLLLLHRDRSDQLDVHRRIVARHDHFRAFRQGAVAGHVGGAEIELRTVIIEEWRVAAALFLGQDVGLGFELLVRLYRAGLAEHLAALDLLALGAAQQAADVVARLARIEQLAEHLDAGDRGLDGVLEADDLDFLADLDLAALDASGHHSAAAGDREHVFDRHQEWLVDRALRQRDIAVERFIELEDSLVRQFALLAIECLHRRTANDRNVVARELVLG